MCAGKWTGEDFTTFSPLKAKLFTCGLALALTLCACSDDSDWSPVGGDSPSSASGSTLAGVTQETSGAVQFKYDPDTKTRKLEFSEMKMEETATATLTVENACGIYFESNSLTTDKIEFYIDDNLYMNNDIYGKNFKALLPCGFHTFKWKILKTSTDGLPSFTVNDILFPTTKDKTYAPEWSFEDGWPTDLLAQNWYVTNRAVYQGSFAMNAGWMQDEAQKSIAIPLADTMTKLNFYYRFYDAAPSSNLKDSLNIRIGNRVWRMPDKSIAFSSFDKFSTILHPGDSEVVVTFTKMEDGFSKFFIDDIRTLRYPDSTQTDLLWDFEDGFYPTEISGDWWIDNFDSYQGEYSLRAPQIEAACGFEIDVGTSDSVSFWNKCSSPSYRATTLRIGSSESYEECSCSTTWKECTVATRGINPLRIETECVIGGTRRIDHLRAW
jgi:hypothetical protein